VEFAVNYSVAAADLLRAGRIHIDRFKCPAWPDLVATVQRTHPVYVHFPLRVGTGTGDAVDTETGGPADWHKVEALLLQTGTPLVNLHLEVSRDDYPHIPVDTTHPAHIEMVTGNLIRDVRAVVQRFGPERVVVENDHSARGQHLRPAFLPGTIHRVVRETGCGLLLDVSHARLAAHTLGMDARDYIDQLPTDRTREIHISGLQRVEGPLVERARRAGLAEEIIQRYAGHLVDHLPITGVGWRFYAWALEQVHRGLWGTPWIVTFEYGGVKGIWEMITDRAVLAEQIPRLRALTGSPALGN
jgi:uncharacterized protein (UPF0276 family)